MGRLSDEGRAGLRLGRAGLRKLGNFPSFTARAWVICSIQTAKQSARTFERVHLKLFCLSDVAAWLLWNGGLTYSKGQKDNTSRQNNDDIDLYLL